MHVAYSLLSDYTNVNVCAGTLLLMGLVIDVITGHESQVNTQCFLFAGPGPLTGPKPGLKIYEGLRTLVAWH